MAWSAQRPLRTTEGASVSQPRRQRPPDPRAAAWPASCRPTRRTASRRSNSSSTSCSSSRSPRSPRSWRPTWGAGVPRGLVLLSLLWFAWCSYSWLGNQAHADEGILRGAYILAMTAMFVVALAIPEAWGDEGGGLAHRFCSLSDSPSSGRLTWACTWWPRPVTWGCADRW